MPRTKPRSEGAHAIIWIVCTMLMFAPAPVFILGMLWWFSFREDPGIHDNATNTVFVVGFVLMVGSILLIRFAARNHFDAMRQRRWEAVRQARDAKRLGEPGLLDQAQRHRTMVSIVPIAALGLGLILVYMLLC
jgi:hypothetical protein